MAGFEGGTVTSVDGLAALYAQPTELYELDHVDAVGRAFIAASPFLVLATGSRHGLDCSPKGDRPGNNKIDGLKNLIEDPHIGLIFFVPGANETYRVNGRARVSVDADLKRRFIVNGKEPATVMVVTVELTFPHCAKALIRSDLWKAGSGGRPQGVPTFGDFTAARNPGTDSAVFDVAYTKRMSSELY